MKEMSKPTCLLMTDPPPKKKQCDWKEITA